MTLSLLGFISFLLAALFCGFAIGCVVCSLFFRLLGNEDPEDYDDDEKDNDAEDEDI